MELTSQQKDFLDSWHRTFLFERPDFSFHSKSSFRDAYAKTTLNNLFSSFKYGAERRGIPEDAIKGVIIEVINDYYDSSHKDAASYLAKQAVDSYKKLPDPILRTDPPLSC